MMRKTLLVAAALLLPFLLSAPAGAAPVDYAAPQVAWVHDVKATADSATLVAKYRCWGGDEGTHLWVSLKQGPEISSFTADELAQMEGTSGLSAAWYDSHPAGVVCNGGWQIQHFTVDRELAIEGYHGDWSSLVSGAAFLQFCLFDNTANETDPNQGFGYLYSWVPVKAK